MNKDFLVELYVDGVFFEKVFFETYKDVEKYFNDIKENNPEETFTANVYVYESSYTIKGPDADTPKRIIYGLKRRNM